MKDVKYVLITPAKNEAAYIGRTIYAVRSQTILPQKWVIVSDGSTDETDEIASSYARKHSFIQLLRAGEKGQKDFGSKVRAFWAGCGELRGAEYDFIGNLDADVTFDVRYFESILEKFQSNPKLGIGGGLILELLGDKFVIPRTSLNSVGGPIQLFRRECYEAIGGFVPMRLGGVDAAVEIKARMLGWDVQTFPEIQVHHHRRVSTGAKTAFGTKFKSGMTNYILGYHALFQIGSSLSRVMEPPYLAGSACSLAGFGWACLRGYKHALPNDVVSFLRAEQMARIRTSLRVWERARSSGASPLSSTNRR
jgi:biofilm PGA synthesis N-glycosyltransferase PgaC